jgi:hypothetical protein
MARRTSRLQRMEERQAWLEKQCRNWNANYPVGTAVKYFPILGDEEFRLRRTRTEAQVLSGHTSVVWLAGESGCVCLDNCSPIEGSAPQGPATPGRDETEKS